MFRGKTVAVVVPAYNEEGFVGDVIDTIPAFVDRLYAIDDRSTDDTWREIQAHVQTANEKRRAAEPRTAVDDGQTPVTQSDGRLTDGGTGQWAYAIRHEENTGVGGAIKTGYRRALEDGVDVTAVMNGDGQMNPDILDRIIEPVVDGEADYTKGNRLLSTELRTGMSTWRFFGNTVLTLLTKISSGYWKTHDPQNGYTAISNHALRTLDLERLYDRYGFCNDVLVKLNAHNLSVADVRMEAQYGEEESDIVYSSFIVRLSELLLRDFLWRLKTKYLVNDFHPLVFFYGAGSVGIGVSVVYGVWALLRTGPEPVSLGITLLLALTGVTLVLFAMLFDMEHNESLEHRHYG